jgi:MFS family permease
MLLKKNIKLLTWFNFFTDFKLYSAIIIIYFARVTHSYALGASIYSITYITAALLDVPTGIFADRLGRKRTVILGALAGVIYAIFYALGGGLGYWFLALGGFFEGLSRAFYSGNNNALLHNMLSDEGMDHEYHEYSGKLRAMFQVGLAASAIVGGLIANWSFTYVMWLSVIPQAICLLISFQIIDSKRTGEISTTLIAHLKEGFSSFIHNANLRLLSIDSILGYGMGETSYEFQPAFFNVLLPLWAVGIARSVSNAAAAISFHFSGKVINEYGEIKTLLWGEIYNKVLNFVALLFPTVISPFMFSATSLTFGTGSVASDTLMQKEFTDAQRATMSSLNSFLGSLFYGVFAFITGFFVDKLGVRNVLLIIQILLLPTAWVIFKLLKRNQKRTTS